jgi:hypothetical protein
MAFGSGMVWRMVHGRSCCRCTVSAFRSVRGVAEMQPIGEENWLECEIGNKIGASVSEGAVKSGVDPRVVRSLRAVCVRCRRLLNQRGTGLVQLIARKIDSGRRLVTCTGAGPGCRTSWPASDFKYLFGLLRSRRRPSWQPDANCVGRVRRRRTQSPTRWPDLNERVGSRILAGCTGRKAWR